MIQDRTFLNLADNSGAKIVQCLRVYKTKKVEVGSLILVTVKQIRPQSKLKKGELLKAIVVRLTMPTSRKNGNYIKCFDKTNHSECHQTIQLLKNTLNYHMLLNTQFHLQYYFYNGCICRNQMFLI